MLNKTLLTSEWQQGGQGRREQESNVQLGYVLPRFSDLLPVKMELSSYCSVAQLCLTLGSPMDCSAPGPSIYGILQARILEWVAIPSIRGFCWPRDQTLVASPTSAGGFFTIGLLGKPEIFLEGFLWGISVHGLENKGTCCKVSPAVTDCRQQFAVHWITGFYGFLTHWLMGYWAWVSHCWSGGHLIGSDTIWARSHAWLKWASLHDSRAAPVSRSTQTTQGSEG